MAPTQPQADEYTGDPVDGRGNGYADEPTSGSAEVRAEPSGGIAGDHDDSKNRSRSGSTRTTATTVVRRCCPRLLEMGYTGSLSVLKAFVHPLRPPSQGHTPVQRFETKPGEQVQFDWGKFKYKQDGVSRKLYGFTAILCYSRMRFVTFVKRCDAPTLIRCLMEAFEYFDGLPKAALTNRMKSVLLKMEDKVPRWHPLFADFMASSIGAASRVCKAYTPQTKGNFERTVGFVKQSFWAGISFTDVDDLNRRAHVWCERINTRAHSTTHERPCAHRVQEPLASFPPAFAWEQFAAEERKVG